jgi:thiaminase/transcriptional activator TenA
MSFTESLRKKYENLWGLATGHPFVKALADGSLPRRKFTYYLIQDAKFLVETSRALALAASKETRPKEMLWLLGLAKETLAAERALHQDYLGNLGFTEQKLAESPWGAANAAYTRHLVAIASAYQPEAALCALLPCFWIYPAVGHKLLAHGEPACDHPYRSWILQYGDPAFMDEAQRIRSYIDGYVESIRKEPLHELQAGSCPPHSAEPMLNLLETLFASGCRYEISFWEMAWTS